MSELTQTVGELRKVLEAEDSYPCPKSALCPSILGIFSFRFMELVGLSPAGDLL